MPAGECADAGWRGRMERVYKLRSRERRLYTRTREPLYPAASRERGKADLVVGHVEDSVVRAHHHVAQDPEAHRRALEAEVGLAAGRAENVVERGQRERHRVAERDRDVLRCERTEG
eukprot:6028856-Prymnesium_polylepis.2